MEVCWKSEGETRTSVGEKVHESVPCSYVLLPDTERGTQGPSVPTDGGTTPGNRRGNTDLRIYGRGLD